MTVTVEPPANGDDLAQWLRESGKRSGPAPREPGDELVAYLEEITGRPIRSREDIRLYFAELEADQRAAARKAHKRQTIWQSALLLALVVAFLQYHYVDVQLAIASLPSLVVFAPVNG